MLVLYFDKNKISNFQNYYNMRKSNSFFLILGTETWGFLVGKLGGTRLPVMVCKVCKLGATRRSGKVKVSKDKRDVKVMV